MLHYANFAAAATCLLVTWMLYRRMSVVTGKAWNLFAGVLVAIAGVILSVLGLGAGASAWHAVTPSAEGMSRGMRGLAEGTLLATYCYWGYYNITFLGGEVRRPERTIPRA